MKKIIGILCIVTIIFSFSQSVFAGSIPEDLLHSDDAQIFFAEVVFYHPNKKKPDIEIVPVKIIKGDIKKGGKQTYYNPNTVGDFDVKPGNVYLFTYFDENNPTDIFDVTSYDTAHLKLKNTDGDMWKRFEKYLNEGKYERAQRERIDRINEALTLENGEKVCLSELLEGNELAAGDISFHYSSGFDVKVSQSQGEKFFKVADSIICTEIEPLEFTNGRGFWIVADDERAVYISEEGTLGESHPMKSFVGRAKYKISSADLEKLREFMDAWYEAYPPIKRKFDIKILLISVSVLFASGFVAGFIIMKKRKGNKTK